MFVNSIKLKKSNLDALLIVSIKFHDGKLTSEPLQNDVFSES